MAKLVFDETGLLPHVNRRRHAARRTSRGCAPSRCRRASCWRPPPSGCRSAAARTSARPTSCPRVRLATIAAAGEAARAVHHRHPDRHRRDAAGAHRGAAGAARPARAPRPPAGDHRPEFPRQARHAHGAASRAVARRPSVDHRGRAHPVRRRDEHPGAAQSRRRRTAAPDRRRHQRLGRRLAGDARSRQSGSAVAGARAPRRRDRATPARCWSSGWRSIRPMRARRRAGSTPALRPRVLRHGGRRRLRARRRLDAGRRPLRRRRCPALRSAPPDA